MGIFISLSFSLLSFLIYHYDLPSWLSIVIFSIIYIIISNFDVFGGISYAAMITLALVGLMAGVNSLILLDSNANSITPVYISLSVLLLSIILEFIPKLRKISK